MRTVLRGALVVASVLAASGEASAGPVTLQEVAFSIDGVTYSSVPGPQSTLLQPGVNGPIDLSGFDLATGHVMALGQARCDADDLRAVEVEDPAGLWLVACRDVVAGQRTDVADAEHRCANNVGLDRDAVLVTADHLHDGLDPGLLHGDGD